MAYHYKENSERLNPSCSSRALSQVNLHDFKIEQGCVEGAELQGNKSVSNIRLVKQQSIQERAESTTIKPSAGNKLKAFITENGNNHYESSKHLGSPRSSVPSAFPNDRIKREVLIDLSNLN